MRRLLLLPALALLAAPASAQTDETADREVVIERRVGPGDAEGPRYRRMIVVDGDTTIEEGFGGRFEHAPGGEAVFEIERHGEAPMRFRERIEGDGETIFRLRGPGGEFRFEGEDGPAGAVRFRMHGGPDMAFFDGDGPLHGVLSRMMVGEMGGGISDETRERMWALEREARELAREARDGDAAAGARLDAVLGDLFEVRAEARREQAAHLRERAAEIEAALAEREANREALIEARRAELLGTGADW